MIALDIASIAAQAQQPPRKSAPGTVGAAASTTGATTDDVEQLGMEVAFLFLNTAEVAGKALNAASAAVLLVSPEAQQQFQGVKELWQEESWIEKTHPFMTMVVPDALLARIGPDARASLEKNISVPCVNVSI